MVAIITTVYNRIDSTYKLVQDIYKQIDSKRMNFLIFLVDDGSTDGTSEVIRSNFPQVIIEQGDGRLFWNGGMRKGIDAAKRYNPDGYLLLNNDIKLYPDALINFFAEIKPDQITVASFHDDNGRLSYGGVKKYCWLHPLKFTTVFPTTIEQIPCDTFNANMVYIPDTIMIKCKNLSKHFVHAKGDFDFGLRARQYGYPIIAARGYYGICNRNISFSEELSKLSGLTKAYRYLLSTKCEPIKERFYYFHKHGGILWPLFFIWPYIALPIMYSMQKVRKQR